MERDEKLPGILEGIFQHSLNIDKALYKLYEEAYKLAGEIGYLVGRISRYHPVELSPGSTVRIEVDPEKYFNEAHLDVLRIGAYLVAVDPKTKRLVLLRVVRVGRSDALAIIGVQPPISSYTARADPSSVATTTIIEAEPIVESELDGEPVPASTGLEPQSPVVEPKTEVLARLLSLPGTGAVVGVLAGPWGPVEGGRIRVRLPVKAFLHHVLIIGTTGSGKTTLIKNMVASMYSSSDPDMPTVIVLDLNQDYVQLAFPPRSSFQYGWERSLSASIRPPSSLVITIPVTMDLLANTQHPCNGLSALYDWYIENSLKPLAGEEFEVKHDIEGLLPRAIVESGGRRIVLVPYAISTLRSETSAILGLMPGLTMFARELLRRLRENFKRAHGFYPPLQAIAASLLAYIYHRQRRRNGSLEQRLEDAKEVLMLHTLAEDEASLESAIAGSPVEGGYSLLDIASEILHILDKLMPHERTVEALYRRVISLVESGLVDIALACGDGLRIMEELSWQEIVGLSRQLRAPVVVDLKPSSESGVGSYEAPRIVAYRALQSVIGWKQEMYAKRMETPRIVVILDEAHQFFPQEKGPREEQEANRQVAGMIGKIARLGRARGLGLVFATHSPRDLHDIILQLANTKIILRTEKSQLDKIQVPSDLSVLIPRLPDRTMVIMSFLFREGYIMAQTPPPLVLHFDASAEVWR